MEGSGAEVLDDILRMKPFFGDNELGSVAEASKENFDDYQMFASGAWFLCGKPPALGSRDAQTVARALVFNVMCNSLSLASPVDHVSFGMGFDPLV